MKTYRLALLGNGYLNQIVATAWADGLLPQYELVAAMGRNQTRTKQFAQQYGCKPCETLQELLDTKPDFVAEAASVAAMKTYGEEVLRGGANLVVLSIGAFADQDFYNQIQKAAVESDRRVYIASGAVGGFDILRATALMGPIKASMTSYKNPLTLRGTSIYSDDLVTSEEPKQAFSGSTKEAIEILPTHFNVAVATALASAGPDETAIEIVSVPGFRGDLYKIEVTGSEVHAELNIFSASSNIAGWSVVAALQNAVNPIVF